VSIWLYDGRLHIAYREGLLARYAYRYDRRARRLSAVERPGRVSPPIAPPSRPRLIGR
jgi:hypothetical protein